MPLTKDEKATIIRLAKEFGVKRMWLFGSMLDPNPDTEPSDIDLAVEGIRPELFYGFYGKLMMELPKSVDLVDLTEEGADMFMITAIARRTGKIIYEERKRNRQATAKKRHTTGKAASR